MIEIKEGWTSDETLDQMLSQRWKREIDRLNSELEFALEYRAQLQDKCKHNHVLFAGQEMTCEVCGARIDK